MPTLAEIEARLAKRKIRKPRPKPSPLQKNAGKPPRQLDRALARVLELANAECGGTWDRPLRWDPIYDTMCSEGHVAKTVTRAVRKAGLLVHPARGDRRLLYPRGVEPPDRPIPRRLVETVERGVEALADELGVSVADVLPSKPRGCWTADEASGAQAALETVRKSPDATFAPKVTVSYTTPVADRHIENPDAKPEFLTTRIGLVSGLRQSTRETLAGHGVGTVADALEKGQWLDELVGSQQAERIRRYARGE